MNEDWSTRIKKITKTILRGMGWGILVIFVIALIGNSIPTLREYLIRGIDRYARWATNRETQRREEAYRNDTHGGKTPEETLDLFIDALKKNDIELASKYYDLSIRERALQSFQEELKKYGNFDKSIIYFSDVRSGKKECKDVGEVWGGCTLEYSYVTDRDETLSISGTKDKIFVPKGSKERKTVDLQLNHYSQVWKITQPY